MWPCRGAELVALTLVLCLGVYGQQAEITASNGAPRGLRKAARGTRGARLAAARASRDVESRDDDYLSNVERYFRGNTFRELDVKKDRDFGDARGRSFVAEQTYDPRDRYSGVNTNTDRYSGVDRDNRFSGQNRDNNRYSADRDTGAFKRPYNFEANEGRDPDSKRKVGNSRSRDYGAIGGRGRDEVDRSFQPTRVNDYGSDATGRAGFGSDRNRNTGPSRNIDSDGQRWLKILEEFLKTSKEGRELLHARGGQLLVGGPGNADGQLPLPVLLVPVAVPDDQCSASKVSSPPPHLQPPEEYLPPHTATADPPVTPDSRYVRPDSDDEYVEWLLKLFREYEPRAPLLPPMLLPESPPPAPPAPLPPPSSDPHPARLRFTRSLLIRAELTVYYSDYTEPYTVWYDAQTGSSRVDMHGGTTVLYRTVRPDGDVQRVQLRIERYEEEENRRCWHLSSSAVDADRSPPGLPDPEPFSFAGYKETEHGRLEHWTYTLAGQTGELGAARGEALLFRHSLLVARVSADVAVPYKYHVAVDSSVLGPSVDWYEHRYLEVREQQPDPSYMTIDVSRECDVTERASRLEHADPLREFVMTHRDTRCDTDFDKFKETYEVNYPTVKEEAMRKTLLIRSTRFVESANRQGASALMEVNEIGVLLWEEKLLLQGLDTDDEDEAGEVGAIPSEFAGAGAGGGGAEAFPHSADEVVQFARQLPAAFSWKRQGGVTHVRNQGECKTCWAFAVIASIEGALFLRTKSLVPLSDQQLVDCTSSKRTCERGNHVRHAFRRVRDAGIVPLANYTRYNYEHPQYHQCGKDERPITKISGYVNVPNNADALKVSIARYGPNVIEVDGLCESFIYFKAGVLIDQRCNPAARGHAITAVGFSKHKLHGLYFIAKNSWGLTGNHGYVHLHGPTNAAGVHTAPSYPLLAEEDVLDDRRVRSLASAAKFPDEKSIFNTDRQNYKQFLRDRKKFNAGEKARQKQNQQKQRRF